MACPDHHEFTRCTRRDNRDRLEEGTNYQRSVAGFLQFLTDFQPEKILVNLNIKQDYDGPEPRSYEPFEYGGFLLMMDTVPTKSPHDYGESYIRVFSTFIPRIIWPNKPLFGRSKWISAGWLALKWIAMTISPAQQSGFWEPRS